jgi:acyl carrier protein
MTEVEEKIVAVLRKLVDPELDRDTRLVDGGLIDSFQVVELLSFVESEFDLRVEPTDLTAEDFATPAAIAGMIERLLAKKAG